MDNHESSIIVDESVGPGIHTPPHPGPRGIPETATEKSRRSGGWIVGIAVLLVAGGLAAFYFMEAESKSKSTVANDEHKDQATASTSGAMIVEVTHPTKGGIERVTDQAGSVHAFEYADLYAKISGYLKVQSVDIGDRVKRNQLLAEIDDPELTKTVEQMKAMFDTSKAKVKISEARIKAAEADVEASKALVTQAKANVETQEANVRLRTKSVARIKGLVESHAIEEKLLDEELDKFEAANSAERFARAAVLSSQAQLIAKQADHEQAKADLEEAKANVEVAKANLEKAQVFVEYTKITSPYDGVITKRTYHRGDFVRSAADGGSLPMLSVAMDAKMRVIVPVPDRDVPTSIAATRRSFTSMLSGAKIKSTVARYASTEDPESRNMRTEVDLENPDGRLKEGMYGRVTIVLQAASPNGVTIPSSALVGLDQKGTGAVFVVRDGKVHKISVQVGSDNGVETEITSGLTPEDQVIVRYNGSIAEGLAVTAQTSKAAPKAGGH